MAGGCAPEMPPRQVAYPRPFVPGDVVVMSNKKAAPERHRLLNFCV